MKRKITILVALLVIGAILFWYQQGRPTAHNKQIWQARCAPIISWLEEQQKLTGRYPDTLSRKYQSTLHRCYPPPRYHSLNNGTSFEITIGDYSLMHTYTYYYMPHTGWGMDQ